MTPPRAVPPPAEPVPVVAERRVERRTPVSALTCDAGRVVDLSARGMRIESRKRWHVGDHRTITITDGDHAVTLEARCIWDRHDSLFLHTIGLAFDHVPPEQEGMLLRLAAEHSA